MFEKGMLRKILGPKREEEEGGWRKLHTEELQVDDFYSSLNISSVMKLRKKEDGALVICEGEDKCIERGGRATWRKETTWKI
jgi:hypothetical protein